MNLLKFAVRSRWTGSVQFTAEIECTEDAPDRIKLGLAVRWAFKAGADLGGADLRGADLRGAKLTDSITINLAPVFVDNLKPYAVTIYDEHMKIGCEFHTLAEWEGFDDRRIAEMDGKAALTFWRGHKEVLLGLAKAAGRTWAVTPAAASEEQAA